MSVSLDTGGHIITMVSALQFTIGDRPFISAVARHHAAQLMQRRQGEDWLVETGG